MPTHNELIYMVREICGDEKEDGFYLPVWYDEKHMQVPNYIFKDGKSQYPEIRISPFISDEKVTNSVRYQHHNTRSKVTPRHAVFQIDIYSENIPELNIIYETLTNRIDLFADMDTLTYGYDKAFEKLDDGKIYRNTEYNNKCFRISKVSIDGYRFSKVNEFHQLKKENTWYLDENALYVHPSRNFNFKHIKIQSVINGMLFANGDSIDARGIGTLRVLSPKMLSELEGNKVERITFELEIFYLYEQKRKLGPIAESVGVKAKEKRH